MLNEAGPKLVGKHLTVLPSSATQEVGWIINNLRQGKVYMTHEQNVWGYWLSIYV